MSGPLTQLPGRGRLGETPRLVFTLALAGFLSGLIIVGAYELTLPRIHANQAAALRRAVFEVLPGSTRMQRLAWRDGKLVPATGEAGDEPSIYAAYDDTGKFVGYALPAEGAGFQDTIRLLFGFQPTRRRIVGMQVLESRETPGLGDRIYKDPAFGAQFKNLAVKPKVQLVKGGATRDNQVDAITGATISSTAVVRILNSADETWLPRLPAEPPPFVAGGEETLPAPAGGPVPGGKQ